MKLHELFEDATIPELRRNIETGFPNTKKRQHATNEVRVNNLQYTPVLQGGLLRVNSKTSTNNGNQHTQILDLRNISFEGQPTDLNVTFMARDNRDYYMRPVQLNTTNVGVFCDCDDYIMRFANYNIQNNCHVGPKPHPYVRKTDDRPSVNPGKVPGLCKHLLRVVDDLKRYGLLT